MLMEDKAYTDPTGMEWDNRGTAEAFASISEYIGNKYNRVQRPHPDTIAKLAKEKANKIAREKGISPEEVSFSEALGIQEQMPIQPNQPTEEVAMAEEEQSPEGKFTVDALIKKIFLMNKTPLKQI